MQLLNGPDFISQCFGYLILQDEFEILAQSLKNSKKRHVRFAQWRAQAKAIDAEFIRMDV